MSLFPSSVLYVTAVSLKYVYRLSVLVCSVLQYYDMYFLFVVQDQLQQKIVCPGVVTCLSASPNGLFLAAAVAEAIYLWEVSQLLLWLLQ